MAKKHLNIRVYGDVQGVGFRYAAQQRARELGVTGFAKNDADDSLYIEAEGNEDSLKKLLAWCKEGPSYATIEKVESEFGEELKKFKEFEIE